MAETIKDSNSVPVMTACLNTDGSTPINIKVNATANAIEVDDGDTGSDLTGDNAPRDNSGYPVMMGVSSSDGITPVPIYATSTGQLLVDSN